LPQKYFVLVRRRNLRSFEHELRLTWLKLDN
jgi:hypothetical protein